jgi:enoyl-CoA hydratase/carnithine racemase
MLDHTRTWALLFEGDEHPDLAPDVIRVLVFPADRQPENLDGYDWGLTWHGGKPQQAPLLEWFPVSERAEAEEALTLSRKWLKSAHFSLPDNPIFPRLRELALALSQCGEDYGWGAPWALQSLPQEWLTRLKGGLSLPAKFPSEGTAKDPLHPLEELPTWWPTLLEARSESGWRELNRRDGAWRILGTQEGGLALVLRHPWLDPITLDALFEALEKLNTPEFGSLQIVAGNVNFCQGANLELARSDLAQGHLGKIQARLERLHCFLDDLEEVTKPVGAAVRGSALGGGCELAMAIPFARFGRDLRMGFVEARMGLIPAGGGLAQVLSRCHSIEDLQRYFRQILLSQVSSDVWQAASLGYVSATQFAAGSSWQELLDDLGQELDGRSHLGRDPELVGWCRPEQLLDPLPGELQKSPVAQVLSQVLGLAPGSRATRKQIRAQEREGYLELLRQPGALGT